VPVTRRLGTYPIISLSQAREIALEALRDISAGVDPAERQRAMREVEARRRADSFEIVARDFIARHVSKLRSGAEAEAVIRRELVSRWGEKPVTEISRRDVVELLRAIADSGRAAAAHRLYNHITKFFTWAIAQDLYGVSASPCAAIRPKEIIGPKVVRQRVLSDGEIRALWQATAALSYPAAPFIRLLLFSGQRRNEIAGMRWTEVDLDKRLWIIPSERMKSDAPHIVPLSSTIVEILQDLPRWTGPFVFSTTSGERPISGFSKLKTKIDGLMPDVAEWRFHDLRRTVRTRLSALRISDIVAELCIGHTQKGLHKIYNQHAYFDERREAFGAWDAWLMSIVEPGAGGNVVPLRA
jgi:integrase